MFDEKLLNNHGRPFEGDPYFIFFIYRWPIEKEIWLRVHVGHVKGAGSLKGQWSEDEPN